MIKKYLEQHNKLGKLYSSYIIDSDNIEMASKDVESFISDIISNSVDLTHNADYMRIAREEKSSKNISVEQIRHMQEFLYKSSVISGRKFALIYAADHMNLNAANCCLKILEDTPSNTYLFLLVENSSILLPTIISRCARITHHYDKIDKNKINQEFITYLLNSTPLPDKLAFLKRFTEKDRDLWMKFANNTAKLMSKFAKKSLGMDIILSTNEGLLFSQSKSASPGYFEQKYNDITKMIRDVEEFDLDLKSNSILLMESMN